MHGTRRIFAKAASASLLGAGLVYLIAEAVTAAAWTRPAYSYAFNWISDLGAPIHGVFAGRQIDSPLHGLMNLAFSGSGLLFFAGALFLTASAQGLRSRLYLGLAGLHALGLLLVACVPETTALPQGGLHRLGALLAIGSGNLAIVLGSSRAPLRRLGLVLGPLGLASLAVLVVSTAIFPDTLAHLGAGVVERASVYTITVWEVLQGAVLLRGSAAAGPR